MPIDHLSGEERAGDIYINMNDFSVAVIDHYCLSPTITLRDVASTRKVGGGVGCLNLKPYKRLEELPAHLYEEVIKRVVRNLTTAREMIDALADEKLELAEKLIAAQDSLINAYDKINRLEESL